MGLHTDKPRCENLVYMYAKDLVCVLPKDETTKMLVQQAVEQVRAALP